MAEDQQIEQRRQYRGIDGLETDFLEA